MQCPECGAKLGVDDTRDYPSLVRRLRKCKNGHKIFSREMFEQKKPTNTLNTLEPPR